MAGNFDPYDTNSWYFGPLTRPEANGILMAESETGVFLIRNSGSIQGDLVLCVREDNRVSHYIINKVQQADRTRFRIGDQTFPDVPALLSFYKRHYLDTTHLMRPVIRKSEKVKARYDFEARDADDLAFKRGEILDIVSKDEELWWTARNALGKTGSIPVPYIEPFDENGSPESPENGSQNSQEIESASPQPPSIELASTNNARSPQSEPTKYNTPNIQRKLPTLPAMAKVKQARVPNAYDKTALKLQIGDIIKVTQTNINGQWEGELNGKVGHFPFTHVDFIDTTDGGQEEQEAA